MVLPPKSPEVNHGDQDETTNIASSAMTDNLIGVILGEEGEAFNRLLSSGQSECSTSCMPRRKCIGHVEILHLSSHIVTLSSF